MTGYRQLGYWWCEDKNGRFFFLVGFKAVIIFSYSFIPKVVGLRASLRIFMSLKYLRVNQTGSHSSASWQTTGRQLAVIVE